MDAREEEQRAAQKLERLNALSVQAGAGAGVWAQVIIDELARHEAAKARFMANEPQRVDWQRYCGSGLVIVLAIGQVIAFEDAVRNVTGDGQLSKARQAFDRVAPDAGLLRDLVTHLSDYAMGAGLRQNPDADRRHGSHIPQRNVKQAVYWTETGDSYLALAGHRYLLQDVARAAITLAEEVERAIKRGMDRERKKLIVSGRRADQLGLP